MTARRVYVACVGCYNSGDLVGQWFDADSAPTDYPDFNAAVFDTKPAVLAVHHQRNGVGGDPFGVIVIRGVVDGTARTFVVTMAHGTDGESYDPLTCRVVDPAEPELSWRGDRFGYELAGVLRDRLDAKYDALLSSYRGGL